MISVSNGNSESDIMLANCWHQELMTVMLMMMMNMHSSNQTTDTYLQKPVLRCCFRCVHRYSDWSFVKFQVSCLEDFISEHGCSSLCCLRSSLPIASNRPRQLLQEWS